MMITEILSFLFGNWAALANELSTTVDTWCCALHGNLALLAVTDYQVIFTQLTVPELQRYRSTLHTEVVDLITSQAYSSA